MGESDSEESKAQERPTSGATKEELDVAPAPEGAVVEGGDAKEEGGGAKELAPSYTLHIRNVPDDVELSEIEMRLGRFGELKSTTLEVVDGSGLIVAKYTRTNDAYAAREKLNGLNLEGKVLDVQFGPQDPEHFARGDKKRRGPVVRKAFLDGAGATVAEVAAPAPRKRPTGDSSPRGGKRAKTEAGMRSFPADDPQAGMKILLEAPDTPVSKWSEGTAFEEQLQDYMKMKRQNMYNRYVVIGKLTPELRTGEAIWRMGALVQRDIMQIEMITCFGKPVSHVAMRNPTAAAALHRVLQQMRPDLTVAFAPPRKAFPTLWLGNVDDYVDRQGLEELLGTYGKIAHRMTYMPSQTCAFITYETIDDAVEARNALYGIEVSRNRFLNVDFISDAERPWDPMEAWAQAMNWNRPAAGPGAPWGRNERGRDDRDRWRATDEPGPWQRVRSPPRLVERRRRASPSRYEQSVVAGEVPARSRSPRRKGHAARSPPRHEARRSPSNEVAPQAIKVKAKLFKMGEFCCNVVASYVKGVVPADGLVSKLQIDQRTKVDHCKSHTERAGELATMWHLSAADRRDCAAYDALCDYFVEKQRVGLVQTPTCYVYLVPPTEKYLKALDLPQSNFMVGLQIPIRK